MKIKGGIFMAKEPMATNEQMEGIFYFVDVLEGLENGITAPECSKRLGVSKNTIYSYLENVRQRVIDEGKILSDFKDVLRERYKEMTFDEVFPAPLSKEEPKKTVQQTIDLNETNHVLKEIADNLLTLKSTEDIMQLVKENILLSFKNENSELRKLLSEELKKTPELQVSENAIDIENIAVQLLNNQTFTNYLISTITNSTFYIYTRLTKLEQSINCIPALDENNNYVLDENSQLKYVSETNIYQEITALNQRLQNLENQLLANNNQNTN